MRPPCVQTADPESKNPSHEDCLYLNIWAPNDLFKYGGGYPILVAFISGGFDGTNQNDQLFNGLKLAESQDIIVVTVSYRVGLFGFLRLNNNEIPGNFGLYDQKLALEWITANINDFGGDRSRVTLLGNGLVRLLLGVCCLATQLVTSSSGQLCMEDPRYLRGLTWNPLRRRKEHWKSLCWFVFRRKCQKYAQEYFQNPIASELLSNEWRRS